MWLAERTAGDADRSELAANVCETTIGGDSPAVMADGEKRSLSVLSPGGVFWKPSVGQNVLVISCGDGAVVAGAVQRDAPAAMQPGELYIKSNGAELRLKNNGDIELFGNISVTGTLKVNGLPVNGAPAV
ncbi:MAG: hypothetical protein RR314_04735 [Oscillospiraceae bacterium]